MESRGEIKHISVRSPRSATAPGKRQPVAAAVAEARKAVEPPAEPAVLAHPEAAR